MLTCRQLLDFLSDFVDGQLSADDLARFDEHLAACPACVDYVENFQATLAACRSLRDAAFQNLRPILKEVVQAILVARTIR